MRRQPTSEELSLNRRLVLNIAAVGVGAATTIGMVSGTALAGPKGSRTATSSTTSTTTTTTTLAPLPPAACLGTYTRLVSVSTAAALTTALKAAQPGDQIQLAPGSYVGRFVDGIAGTATAPIVICGPSTAIIDGGGLTLGVALSLTNAPYTRVAGITVTDAKKGVMLDNSSHSVLSAITVHGIGQEAVHLRRATSDSVVENSTIFDTGQVDPQYGEGVYVGSASNNWCVDSACGPDQADRNVITGNKIGPGVTAEEIDIKEGTTGGTISGNTFDGSSMVNPGGGQSWVDVKGNGWLITGNTGRYTFRHGFTDSLAVTGWGNDNTFAANTEYVNSTGYGVRVTAGITGVRVLTSNVVVGAASGVANIALTVG
jgi:hypothetical protein